MGGSGARGDGKTSRLICMGIMPIRVFWHQLGILAKLNIWSFRAESSSE
jgi:hypothetical protein